MNYETATINNAKMSRNQTGKNKSARQAADAKYMQSFSLRLRVFA